MGKGQVWILGAIIIGALLAFSGKLFDITANVWFRDVATYDSSLMKVTIQLTDDCFIQNWGSGECCFTMACGSIVGCDGCCGSAYGGLTCDEIYGCSGMNCVHGDCKLCMNDVYQWYVIENRVTVSGSTWQGTTGIGSDRLCTSTPGYAELGLPSGGQKMVTWYVVLQHPLEYEYVEATTTVPPTTTTVITCDPKYLNEYQCSGDYRQRKYQYGDCSTAWLNYEFCDYGCLNGACNPPPGVTTTTVPATTTTVPKVTTTLPEGITTTTQPQVQVQAQEQFEKITKGIEETTGMPWFLIIGAIAVIAFIIFTRR